MVIKKLKTKDKKVKRKRMILAFLYSLILFLLLGIGWRLYWALKESVWDGVSSINLVFQTQPVLVTSFKPEEKSLVLLLIPDGTYIEAIHGYGPYRVESLYQLGELEGQGGEMLSGSLQEYLGIPVDAYASINHSRLPDGQEEFRIDNFKNPEELRDFLGEVIMKLFRFGGKTSLTRWDLIRLWWQIGRVRSDKVRIVNLGQTSASLKVVLPDGSEATKVDPERLERIIKPLFIDGRLRAENLAIVVLNGTTHPGLAHRGARIVSNMGGRVVGIGDSETNSDGGKECEIKSGQGYKNSYTLQRLAKIFGCQWGGENLERERAEVVLILTEGYWRKLTAR